MLEHVALGQSRFVTPGVSPDPRGVLLGRYALLAFSTLEGVVSWFRLYSAESSMDELIPSMAIHRARTPLGSQELLMRIPATSSYALDRAARCAKLVGGATFTGTSKHFVKYRDDRSPYGYDAVEINVLPQGADLMVHGQDYVQTYIKETELHFDKLLFQLSLRRKPGEDKLRDDEREELYVVCARGLADGMIRYLWRNRVEAEVALVKPQGASAFGDPRGGMGFLLLKVRKLPKRILELLMATPGLDVFRPIGQNVAVQVGYVHVIDLGSCTTLFDERRFYVFWGASDRVDVIDGPLELSSAEHLTKIEIDLEKPRDQGRLQPEAASAVHVPLRLAPSLTSPRRVAGTLIPLDKAQWLKRLIYALPPTSLRGHRVGVTDRGILLVGQHNVDIIPLGQLLSEIAPGLLVPLGMDLVPRVAPDVVARSLGHAAGVFTVFPHSESPFQVSDAALVSLERRSLASIEVDRAVVDDRNVAAPRDPSVVNDPVGRFALWGFRAPAAEE